MHQTSTGNAFTIELQKQHSRRDFLLRTVAGIAVPFGIAEALSKISSATELPVIESLRKRPFRDSAVEIIDDFYNATPSGIFSFYQHFSPKYLNKDLNWLSEIDDECKKRLQGGIKNTHRLITLPSVARIHTLPYLSDPLDRASVIERITHQIALAVSPDEAPNRSAIEVPFQVLSSILVNQDNWARFRAGKMLLEQAFAVCKRFIGGEDALLYASLAALQFLLTYERALLDQIDLEAYADLNFIRHIKSDILAIKFPNVWWLLNFERFHRAALLQGRLLPPYHELLFLRNTYSPGSLERQAADFIIIVRMQMTWVNHRVAQGLLQSIYLTQDHAAQVEQSSIKLLQERGLDKTAWYAIMYGGRLIFDDEAIPYFESNVIPHEFPEETPHPFVAFMPFVRSASSAVADRVYRKDEKALRHDILKCQSNPESFVEIADRTAWDCVANALPGPILYQSRGEFTNQLRKSIMEERGFEKWASHFERAAEEAERIEIEKKTIVTISAGLPFPTVVERMGYGGSVLERTFVEIPPHNFDNSLNKVPIWKGSLDTYSDKCALTFENEEALDRFIDDLWQDKDLAGIPRNYGSEDTIILPAEAIDLLKGKGYRFSIANVVSASSRKTR